MSDWPDTIRVRDTELHDDLGGCGQRIYTTAGQGYEKMAYVRHDLYEKQQAEIDHYRSELIEIASSGCEGHHDDGELCSDIGELATVLWCWPCRANLALEAGDDGIR